MDLRGQLHHGVGRCRSILEALHVTRTKLAKLLVADHPLQHSENVGALVLHERAIFRGFAFQCTRFSSGDIALVGKSLHERLIDLLLVAGGWKVFFGVEQTGKCSQTVSKPCIPYRIRYGKLQRKPLVRECDRQCGLVEIRPKLPSRHQQCSDPEARGPVDVCGFDNVKLRVDQRAERHRIEVERLPRRLGDARGMLIRRVQCVKLDFSAIGLGCG